MKNTNTNTHTARKLYRRSNYADSERVYRELFYKDKDAFERDDIVFFLKSIDEACIKNNYSSIDLEEQAKFVLENFSQEDCSNRNFRDPYAEIFIDVARNYNDKHKFFKAFEWLWKLNRDYLTTFNPRIRSNRYGYSLKEKWYSSIIESLDGMEKYEGALELASEAMEKLPDSKSDAKLFIHYKSAKIHNKIGNYEDSLNILHDIAKVKKESFVYTAMARNYFGLGNYDEALSYAIKAALANRSVQNNIGTYTLIAELLEKKDLKNEAIKHYYLVYAYKKANNYRINQDLSQIIEEANLDMENTNFRRIQKELVPLWNELKYVNMVRYSGTIKKVFEDKRIGFISNDFDSNDTFFSFKDFKDNEDFIYPGTKVSFYVEDTFDKSKGRDSTKAVEIDMIY